ncbi:DUF481 domain-containing protein [bacterium]|nr:DUF481 domain-containing protein [bacterium]
MYLSILLVILIVVPSFSNNSDQVFLENGSVLMVQKIHLQDGNFSCLFLNKPMKIQIEQIQKIILSKGYTVGDFSDVLYQVTSQTKAVHYSFIKIKQKHFAKSEIKTIFFEESQQMVKKKLSKWSGSFDIGYQNQSGNVHQHKLHYFAKFEKVTIEDGLHFELFGRNGNDTAIGRNESGNLKGRYCVKHQNKTWQFVELKYDYNRVLGIHSHHNFSIGTGWDLLKNKNEYLLLSTGIGSDRLYRSNNQDSSFLTGVIIFDFKRKLFDSNYLEGNLNMYPRLNKMSNLKADSRVSLVHPLNDKSSVKMTLQQNYLSEIASNKSKFDRQFYMSYNHKF